MAKSGNTLNRRHFLGAAGAGLVAVASGCRPKAKETEKTVHAVEDFLDLHFTDKEWQQLSKDYEARLDLLRRIRQLKHPNHLAPAQVFDPRLPGIDYAEVEPAFQWAASAIPLPPGEEDIAFAPATHLAHWLRTRQISSLDLTEIYIRRIQTYNTGLQCFITVTSDLARKQARQADMEITAGNYRSPLHGLPYGLKDLFDTAGIQTTWGANTHRNYVPDTDAHIVKKLREAGAVLLGKTSCGALAYGDIWFDGVTRNPWDTREGSSGSSAGSASATAAGLVAFSIGTETLGSIISPSVRCGVTGLRPTFGRVGRSGGMTLCWSMDKIGPICRTVEDTALVLHALNGPDAEDPGSLDTSFAYDGHFDLSGLTVGFDPEVFDRAGNDGLNLKALAAAESAGVRLKEISLPETDSSPLYLQLLVESAAAFEDLTLSNRDDELRWQEDRSWPNTWRKAQLIPAVAYIQADRLRRIVMEEMHTLFESVDLILGDNFGGGMLRTTNFTGHPQLTLPCGFRDRELRPAYEETSVRSGEKARLPHSIGLWGPLYGEGQMMAFARAIEEKFGLASTRPAL